MRTDYWCILHEADRWFSDHLRSLAGALDRNPRCEAACAGIITEREPTVWATQRTLEALTPALGDSSRSGNSLFRRRLIAEVPLTTLQHLDGEERSCFTVFAAEGDRLAASGRATYVDRASHRRRLPAPAISVTKQRGWIAGVVQALRNQRASEAASRPATPAEADPAT